MSQPYYRPPMAGVPPPGYAHAPGRPVLPPPPGTPVPNVVVRPAPVPPPSPYPASMSGYSMVSPPPAPVAFAAPHPPHFVGGFAPAPVIPPQRPGYPPHAAPSSFAGPPRLAPNYLPGQPAPGPPRSPSAPPVALPAGLPASHSQPNDMPALVQHAGRLSLQPGGNQYPPRAASSSYGHAKHHSASDIGHGLPPGGYPPSSRVSSSSHDRRSSEQSRPPRASWDYSSEARATGGSASSASGAAGLPQLTCPVPDPKSLEVDREKALASGDPRRQLQWAASVLKYVERKGEPSKLAEPPLAQWIEQAITIVNKQAGGSDPVAEALYLRGDLQASGAYPAYLRKDLRSAFNDFELAARMGHAPAWFRIGRDYEVLNDMARAKVAYEHGCTAGDVGSTYRMGMAHLLGQLDISVNYPRAIALLKSAADKADLDTPQPAYIFGMLLAGEFSHVPVPAHLLQPESGSTEAEARRRIERAAYYHFVPAQYKCGWCYEHARLDCAYDPLMSVQWYSLASQGGEVEADMALSKWFLCGAEGCFDVDETLAFTFADKAARKGLPSAEFAMGYYFEVGVGVEQDLNAAKKWYRRAADHGNKDAKERLAALDKPAPETISRRDHIAHVDTKLQHTRTIAKNRSRQEGRRPPTEAAAAALAPSSEPSASSSTPATFTPAAEMSRKKTMRLVQETAGVRGGLRRLAGRLNKLEGSEAGPPLTSTTIAPPPMNGSTLSSSSSSGAVSSQRPPSRSERVPSHGYAQSGPPPGTPGGPPPVGYGQPPSTPQRQRLSSTPGPGLSAGGTPGMAANSPRRSWHQTPPSSAHGAPGPPPVQYGTPTHSAHPSQLSLQSGSSLSGSSGSAGGSGAPGRKPDPVVYQTFAEMGFASSKTKGDKDCIIM